MTSYHNSYNSYKEALDNIALCASDTYASSHNLLEAEVKEIAEDMDTFMCEVSYWPFTPPRITYYSSRELGKYCELYGVSDYDTRKKTILKNLWRNGKHSLKHTKNTRVCFKA